VWGPLSAPPRTSFGRCCQGSPRDCSGVVAAAKESATWDKPHRRSADFRPGSSWSATAQNHLGQSGVFETESPHSACLTSAARAFLTSSRSAPQQGTQATRTVSDGVLITNSGVGTRWYAAPSTVVSAACFPKRARHVLEVRAGTPANPCSAKRFSSSYSSQN